MTNAADGVEHRLHVQQTLGEHQWEEDDEVLRPLRRPEGQYEAQGHRPDRRRLRIDPLDLKGEVRNCMSRHPERGG